MNTTGRPNGSVSHHHSIRKCQQQGFQQVCQTQPSDSPPVESDPRRSDSDLYRFSYYVHVDFYFQYSCGHEKNADFSPSLKANDFHVSGIWARACLAVGGRSWATSFPPPTRFPSSPSSRSRARFEGQFSWEWGQDDVRCYFVS